MLNLSLYVLYKEIIYMKGWKNINTFSDFQSICASPYFSCGQKQQRKCWNTRKILLLHCLKFQVLLSPALALTMSIENLFCFPSGIEVTLSRMRKCRDLFSFNIWILKVSDVNLSALSTQGLFPAWKAAPRELLVSDTFLLNYTIIVPWACNNKIDFARLKWPFIFTVVCYF